MNSKDRNSFPEKNINKRFALVDCNNFYASCERIFRPALENKPIIVLSNNDGCVIARTNEAKALGIKMGTPAYEYKSLVEKYNINVFSSNYALYGDISGRVMSTLSVMAPEIEIYSIDEAFLDVTGVLPEFLEEYASQIIKTVNQWTGIPVSIGIGSSKTQAKIANYMAKKFPEFNNICIIDGFETKKDWLEKIPVSEIWGVGRQYGDFLNQNKINSVWDFINTEEHWIRKHMHVVGQKTLYELRGISCLSLETIGPAKQSICTSRSFGKSLQHFEDVEQATATFVVRAAEKLRQQKSLAGCIVVFLMTNRFSKTPKYVNSVTIQLPVSTDITSELIHFALVGLKKIYRKGYLYKKSGIILTEISSASQSQLPLWEDKNREKHRELMAMVDRINSEVGKETIKYAVQGYKRSWKMNQEKLSPDYVGKWEEILKIWI